MIPDIGENVQFFVNIFQPNTTIELQVICPPLEFVDKFVESLQIYKKSAAGENFGKL